VGTPEQDQAASGSQPCQGTGLPSPATSSCATTACPFHCLVHRWGAGQRLL